MNVNDLPVEIIQNIFGNLIGTDVLKCREVCRRWQQAVDGVSDEFWRKICKKGSNYTSEGVYGELYEDTYKKASLSWRELYITLSLWPKVKTADFQIFKLPETVVNFQIIADGIIGYPCNTNYDNSVNYPYYCNTIVYYDLTTMQEHHRTNFDISFTDYAENDKLILVINVNRLIDVTIKSNNKRYTCLEDDFLYLLALLDKEFYYQKLGMLCCCKLVELNGDTHLENIEITEIHSDWKYIDDITSFGNEVYVRTLNHEIHSIKDRRIEPCISFYNCGNSLDILRYYGFKWTARDISYHLRMHSGQYYAEQHVPHSLFTTDVNAAWVFDKVIIIATPAPYRKLLIYYNPYDDENVLALFNTVPDISVDLDAYGIGDTHRKPRVKKIDVVEAAKGHSIIVLCDGIVYVIDVNHNGRQTKPR